jgi:hypothetical protein
MAGFLWGVGRARFLVPALIFAGVLIGSTGATAGPAVSTTTPFTFGGTNTCTGETFLGTGNMHFLISGNLSSGGNVQFHIEAGFAGLQAVTTFPFAPKKYLVIDEEDLLQTFDTDGAPAHETFEQTLQFVRTGEGGTVFPDDDFYLHVLAHITANANYTVTVEDVDTDTRCR